MAKKKRKSVLARYEHGANKRARAASAYINEYGGATSKINKAIVKHPTKVVGGYGAASGAIVGGSIGGAKGAAIGAGAAGAYGAAVGAAAGKFGRIGRIKQIQKGNKNPSVLTRNKSVSASGWSYTNTRNAKTGVRSSSPAPVRPGGRVKKKR